jgi:hypothetical protein
MADRHVVTLQLTDTQVRALRQAVYDFADQRYEARMERLALVRPLIPSDRHPCPMETAAWDLVRRVDKATDATTSEVTNA